MPPNAKIPRLGFNVVPRIGIEEQGAYRLSRGIWSRFRPDLAGCTGAPITGWKVPGMLLLKPGRLVPLARLAGYLAI
jgi:hypothetical protein